MIDLNLDVKFSARQYKSFLNRLKKLGLLIATVGIHAEQGKQPVIRRYTKTSSNGNEISKRAGATHRMTVAKLAYQNEFGANITIRPRYKTRTENKTTIYNSARHRITETVSRKYSAFAPVKQQGYLLLNKQGKFVAYFKPNSVIHIPERSFLRKTAKNLDPKVQAMCSDVLANILVNKSVSPTNGMKEIAKIIELKVKQNIRNVSPKNHELTRKAKGFNMPLVDEKDRILKSIKYKIYKNPYELGSKGNIQYLKQFDRQVDKVLKNATMYEKIAEQITTKQKVFAYKIFNPYRSEYLK